MPSKKSLIQISMAVLATGLLCVAYAYFVEPRRLVLGQYEMLVANWNPAFDGFRVAVISDIHAGSNGVTAERIRELVERTNEQDVDAVFLLGDFVSQIGKGGPGRVRTLRMSPAELGHNLSGLRARYGVFAVLGNHDEWYADNAAIIAELEKAGCRVLNGEVAVIHMNDGSRLRILGLRDHTTIETWKGYSEYARGLLAPTEGTGDVIVLQHSPDVLPVITGELSISPQLRAIFAGHTHGGQVWLPIIGAPIVPSSYGQKYARGHIRDRGVDMFVTSGIGTSILPLRFLVPPEISIVTVRRPPE